MVIQCSHCHEYKFEVDYFNSKSINWIYIVCAKCTAKYQLKFEQGTITAQDVTTACPKCQTLGFDADWNKNTRTYDSLCGHCGYKETRPGD